MFQLILRIGFSLLVVLGLLWVLGRALRGPGRRGAGALAVLARQQLTRGGAVAVVRVADRTLVLGVTDQRVSLLAEANLDLDAPDGDRPAAGPEPGSPSEGVAASAPAWQSLILQTLGGHRSGRRATGRQRCVRQPLAHPVPVRRGPAEPGTRTRPGAVNTGAVNTGAANTGAANTGAANTGAANAGTEPGRVASALAGSVLSPQTWRDTVEFLRERTVRKQ